MNIYKCFSSYNSHANYAHAWIVGFNTIAVQDYLYAQLAVLTPLKSLGTGLGCVATTPNLGSYRYWPNFTYLKLDYWNFPTKIVSIVRTVYPQSTNVTDGRMDRWTNWQTDNGQNWYGKAKRRIRERRSSQRSPNILYLNCLFRKAFYMTRWIIIIINIIWVYCLPTK